MCVNEYESEHHKLCKSFIVTKDRPMPVIDANILNKILHLSHLNPPPHLPTPTHQGLFSEMTCAMGKYIDCIFL